MIKINEILQKRNDTSATVLRNYFANGFEEGSDSYFYTKDHLGSIREVVADDGTTVESRYDYSPWGEVTKIGGTGVESDFLYTGHFYHRESELFLTWFRAYDPALGRWLSRDPIRELGGLNIYAYVRNNPINLFDPLGLRDIGPVNPGPNDYSSDGGGGSSRSDCNNTGFSFSDFLKSIFSLGNAKSVADKAAGVKPPNFPVGVASGAAGTAGGGRTQVGNPEAQRGALNITGYLGRIKAASEASDPNEMINEIEKTNAEKNAELMQCDE